MAYVVMVRGVDDSYDAYGPVRDQARAESFAGWFNAQVEAFENEQPDKPDGVAWAYVMPLRKLNSDAMCERSGVPKHV